MIAKTVLIIEDDFIIALDYKWRLEKAGWKVVGPAATVQAALRLIQTEPPTVALLDMHLCGQLVTPVAVALKAQQIPFVVCSGADDIEVIGGPVFAGVVNVEKPVRDGYLQRALEIAVKGFPRAGLRQGVHTAASRDNGSSPLAGDA